MNTIPFARLGIGLGLLIASVVIHALFLASLLRQVRRWQERARLGAAHAVWVLVRVALWTVVAHLTEMMLWAVAYLRLDALPTIEASLYFSMVTYTTVGYGDVVLPAAWHILAGLEGLTGILMAGWSTAFLFAVVTRLISNTEEGVPRPGAPSR